ncbi:WG containing repeat-containing protein [Paenimyroides aquimaris]|uniref:WG containing repeat-containing protein n=2 Tax=Paenimyroides marinum TaxID=1159016 RepID=A0A1H6MDL0_9FLAO|nr:WG containing repeat-containing protein [Paenimyroides aquimaris]
MLSSNACAQTRSPVDDTPHEVLYPYRDKSERFGYADENLHIQIEPQYKNASLFTEHGFAVISDSLNKKGVIDQNNKLIIVPEYDVIHLHTLEDFTLAEVHKSYYTRWRFWEWKFLPGFNLMGTGNDNRLFDTKVKRLKKTVFVLGDKPRKVRSERLTNKGYTDKYFDVSTLDSNQVLINGRLYDIRAKGARFIASGIIDPLTVYTFAQRKGVNLYTVDRKGNRVDKEGYTVLDSIAFKVEDVPVGKRLTRDYAPIASAYRNEEGLIFIYPDFSKALPRLIHENMHPDDPTAEELIRGLWMLASVPESGYFVFMSFRDGERFFRFLDTEGNWHQTLPPDIPFTVIQRSGNILWPEKEHYIPRNQIPEGWKIDRISPLGDSSMYHITLQQGKTVRQGIWDFVKQQWLITPEYYEVYPMDNTRQWRYHSEYDGLWGLMDDHGKVLIKPTYYSLHPDGWVSQQENDESISFYLHPQTLEEFREK